MAFVSSTSFNCVCVCVYVWGVGRERENVHVNTGTCELNLDLLKEQYMLLTAGHLFTTFFFLNFSS